MTQGHRYDLQRTSFYMPHCGFQCLAVEGCQGWSLTSRLAQFRQSLRYQGSTPCRSGHSLFRSIASLEQPVLL